MTSVGYSEKAPSMHDQNLALQTTSLYEGIDSTITQIFGYADVGNKTLKPEKQLVGSFMYEYGSQKNNLRFSATGGLINDGINWYQTDTTINLQSLKLFIPKNVDIKFVDFQLKQKLALGEWLNLSMGSAYHFIDNDYTDFKPYQPEYQMFFGGELHYYWKQKIVDLYAYGEAIYAGPYSGYFDEPLGDNVTINTGLAFQMKRFRFYYIFQNSMSVYRTNFDGNNSFGQFSYYGISWYFIN